MSRLHARHVVVIDIHVTQSQTEGENISGGFQDRSIEEVAHKDWYITHPIMP